jgi:hypothetical protein
MKKTLPLLFCLLLAGCTDTDWDNALNYTGLRGSAEQPEDAPPTPVAAAAAASPAEAAAAPQGTDFCRSVAMQDASGSGFDQPTQQRVFARSYAQCMTLGVR